MLQEHAQSELQKLEQQIASLQAQIKKLPPGKIFCCKDGNRYKWYHSNGKTQKYILKKDRHFAEQLAIKRYLTLLLKEFLQEKHAIESYLKRHNFSPSEAEEMLTNSPVYQELLSPFFKSKSQELDNWMNLPYERNPKYPEQLTIKTCSGNFVRSKSEALIDMMLYTNRIPFRYECALHLGDSILYPDFTIRHPKTGKIYYWEHFGRMDDLYYSQNTYSKLQLYTSHGIIQNIHLITTFETKQHPLSSETIEKIVKEYFL